MADELPGGAPAPAETPATPEVQNEVVEKPETSKAEPTPRGAIDRAFASLEEGGEPEKAATGERSRNPDGTFAPKGTAESQPKPVAGDEQPKAETQPKPQAAIGDAPERFKSDREAMAAWAATPEAVKAATHRALREAEQGIEKYRGAASRYDQVWRPFEELALASRMDPAQTLKGYVQIDQLLSQDFNKGIAAIFQRAGKDPKAWVAELSGQAPPAQDAKDTVIAELRNEIMGLKQAVSGIHGTVQETKQANIGQALDGYVGSLSQGDQALFEELDTEIAAELNADPGSTLAQAFERAKNKASEKYTRMFGAPQAAQTREPPPAQTGKGNLQITGAPGPGSDPAVRKTPSSARAALDSAFAQVGL